MKNLIKNTLFFILLGAIMISCEKEEIFEENPTNNNLTKSKVITNKSYDPTNSITVENDMMVFNTINHFIETETYLNDQLENWDNTFLDIYGHLDDDSLGTVEDSLNYNNEQPLEDLEISLGFNSLRKNILIEENDWLASEGEIIDDDPDNHYITDEVIRTLLNVNAEVKIEGSIYVMLESVTVQIVNGSIESLDSVRNAININEITSSNIKIIDYPVTTGSGSTGGSGSGTGGSGGDPDPCNAKTNKRNQGYEINGKYRIKWVVSVWTHPWDCGAIAKTKHYKKKKSKWKKRRATIYAKVHGDMVNAKSSCSKHAILADVQKRKRKVKTQRVGALCTTEKNLIGGVHKRVGITYNSTLTW